jgi:DNA-binding protein H-NS
MTLSSEFYLERSMATHDLKSLSRKELEKLKSAVEKALERSEAQVKALARQAAEKAVAAFGLELHEVTSVPAPKRRGRKPGTKNKPKGAAKAKAPAKYRNPADATQTWSGRGRKPQWFKDAEASGKDISTLAI